MGWDEVFISAAPVGDCGAGIIAGYIGLLLATLILLPDCDGLGLELSCGLLSLSGSS